MADILFIDRRATQRPVPDAPPDWREREQALDIQTSWIVEAPAGSGKTGLLIQRYLKLLADESVTEPEQVMAITFTVKATAELRERVLTQLEAAAAKTGVTSVFDRATRKLAEAVLRRDGTFGWALLTRPERMRIRTIDSVCAEIAGALPVLSGSGGRLKPLLSAEVLYREAARRIAMQMGGADQELNRSLETLLLHRDGNLAECERLIAGMLGWRDQWGGLVPSDPSELTDEALDQQVLTRLERALDQAICAGLQQLARSIPADVLQSLTFLAWEMGHSAGYKGSPSPLALCANLSRHQMLTETTEHLGHWKALVSLLLKGDDEWRDSLNVNHLGFMIEPHHKTRLKELLDSLRGNEDIHVPLKRLRSLPPARYPEEQWRVTKALFRVLQRALVELQLVFAERGECDFTQLGLLARTALRVDEHGDDLAAALGQRLQHLLVDEMQDTSTSQYEFIERLTAGWDGRSQTVFLVGDPKQSIYLFRQARVERFVRTMRTGKLGDLPVGSLRLTANFRSQSTLVEEVNADFARLFPREVTPLHPEDVPFVVAEPVRPATGELGRNWHTVVVPADELRTAQAWRDAKAIRRIVQQWRAKKLSAKRTKPWSIAVLVRARGHLAPIVAALKEAGVPFRAVDIEVLGEHQEVLDLVALTRALLHPADRVAWLAILRAPWCGLTLPDLHLLAGGDERRWAEVTVAELMDLRGELLSADGGERLRRLQHVMQAAARQRGRLTAAQWVERTWRSLGGDVSLSEEAAANAGRYLSLLDELERGGQRLDAEVLAERLKTLYAVAAAVPGAVDLMTIHSAKGLEWDVVIVPALERPAQRTRGRLLQWAEMDTLDPETAHVVLAPIAGKGEESQELNKWLQGIENSREAAERKRLLYVAATRAREELHLFAAPQATADGKISVASDSLLKAAWPAVHRLFNVPGSVLPDQVPVKPAVFQLELALAASAEEEEPEPPPLLRRLPAGFDPSARFATARSVWLDSAGEPAAHKAFDRPEGSFVARAFGNAVHGFIEVLAKRVAGGASSEALRSELPEWRPRVSAVLRGEGLAPAVVERLSDRVLEALTRMLADETGHWVLAAHPGAASEQAVVGWAERRTSLRLDRIFRAGPEPLSLGDDCLWVVDFKTATHGQEGLDAFLATERGRYAGQMEAYAAVLGGEVRLMLYYPLLAARTWWVFHPEGALPNEFSRIPAEEPR